MKNFLRLTGLVLVLLAVSCGTIQTVQDVPPYTYTGGNPIYPAVFNAVVNGDYVYWRDSTPTIVDPYTVVIDDVMVADGLKMSYFTIKISLVNNVITYQFSNIRQKLPTETNWTRVERFSMIGREKYFINYFNTEIPKIMENDELYAELKSEIDGNLGLNY